jgi:hypothetical protein
MPPAVGEVKPRESLKDVEQKPQPLVTKQADASDRTIEESERVAAAASQAASQARKQLEGLIAGKGRGGPGSGGGRGKGKGTGEGDLEGPGKANIGVREKRQLRWTMVFNTRDGRDYVKQLQALGAIVAIPGPNKEYLVIRDLSKRPVEMQPEDLSKIDRIYWIDDNPQSVESFARELRLKHVPELIAAFFPLQLEQELAEKERRHSRSGREDDILETRFQVRQRGGQYEVVVVSQRVK